MGCQTPTVVATRSQPQNCLAYPLGSGGRGSELQLPQAEGLPSTEETAPNSLASLDRMPPSACHLRSYRLTA